jgi:hypothetical protein
MINDDQNEIKKNLNYIFHEEKNCKENKLSINKKGIKFIFKPDKGIKNKELQKELFPNEELPKLCDCIIQKDDLILLELKYEMITNSILKDIEQQLLNVGKILKKKNINFDRAVFIYHRLDNSKMKQVISKKLILDKRLEYFKFENKAIYL